MEICVQRFRKAAVSGDMDTANKIYYDVVHHNEQKLFHKIFLKQLKETEVKTYEYMITFTLKADHPIHKIQKIENYIVRQVCRPALQILEAWIVKEKTKQNRDHWHLSVKSKKFISRNRFNYYEKLYGYVDISKSTDKSLQESINYMSKCNIPYQLVSEGSIINLTNTPTVKADKSASAIIKYNDIYKICQKS